MIRIFSQVVLLFFVALVGCKEQPPLSEQEALVQKGKGIYVSLCIACHNLNPRLPGALGPDLAGSSLELLQAKVLKSQYPTNYTPKIGAKNAKVQMPAMPFLEKDILAIHAFLNSSN